MAKQGRMVLSGFSGRLGSVIGYRRGGTWCVRSMPQQVHNPRTEAQQRHRSLFRAEVQLAARMRWPVVMALADLARERHMTAQNLFVRLNHRLWSVESGERRVENEGFGFEVDYSRLQLSMGRLAPVAVTGVEVEPLGVARSAGSAQRVDAAVRGLAPTANQGGTLTITVSFEPCRQWQRAGRYDEVFLYAYSPSAAAGYLFNSVYRYTRRISVVLPEWLQTDDIQLYLLCKNSRGEWSPTVHADIAATADAGTMAEREVRQGHAPSATAGQAWPASVAQATKKGPAKRAPDGG